MAQYNLRLFGDVEEEAVSAVWGDGSAQKVKEYESEKREVIQKFFNDTLLKLNQLGLVSTDPARGKQRKLIIRCLPSKRTQVTSLLVKLDREVETIQYEDVSMTTNYGLLVDYIKKEEETQSPVLYLPDAARQNVRVYFREDDRNMVVKLRKELGIIPQRGSRKERRHSQKGDEEDDIYDDVASPRQSRDLSTKFEASVKLDSKSSKNDDDDDDGQYEAMDWQTSAPDHQMPVGRFNFEKTFNGGLRFKVYKESILRLKVESIVNAANDCMMHGGGVARVISDGAGQKLDWESRDQVNKYGDVKVTKNIVTSAGKLPYKSVIHAVGPQWHMYGYDEKVKCLDDLYETIMNVFITCDRDGIQRVAMPAISAGIFGVPKQLCTDMYVKASVDFDEMLSTGRYRYPSEVHFVDIDTEILKLVKVSVQKWEVNRDSIDQRKTIPLYMKDHPMSAGRPRGRYNRAWSSGSGATSSSYDRNKSLAFEDLGINCEVKRLQEEKFRWGGTANVYRINSEITVKIFKGDIDKASGVDVVVCGIGKDLVAKGFIADALKRKGGTEYIKKLETAIKDKKKPHVGSIVKCKAGDLKVGYVFHVVLEKLKDASNEELKDYSTCVFNVLKKARDEGLKKIAMPMFATGLIQTNEEKLKKCCIKILQAFDKFCDEYGGKGLKITEVHLGNNSENVCKALVGIFDTATKTYGHHARRQSSFESSEGNRSGHNREHGSGTRWKHDGGYNESTRGMDDNANRRSGKDGKTYSSQDANASGRANIINRGHESPYKDKRRTNFEKQPLPQEMVGASSRNVSGNYSDGENVYDAVYMKPSGANKPHTSGTSGDNGNVNDDDYAKPSKKPESNKSTKPTPEHKTTTKGNLLIFED